MDGSFSLPDSHAHLDMDEFDADRAAVLERARAAGVDEILCPIDITNGKSAVTVLRLTAEDRRIRAAAGLHPHQARLDSPALLDAVRRLALEGRIVAVGEIGLDYHYDFSSPREQRDAFRRQLALAADVGLPVIIHSRNAGGDIAAAVREEGFSRGGVLHCFTEDWEFARIMLDAGFYISFSGIVTFPNAGGLREIAARVPADRLLLETDAPYLAPVPHRGRRNEPAFIVATAERVAEVRGVGLAALAETVARNYRAAFPASPNT
jgi:TatD DNase family protein